MFMMGNKLGILGINIYRLRKVLTSHVGEALLFHIPIVLPAIRLINFYSVLSPNSFKLHYTIYLPDFCLYRKLKLQTKTYFV